MLGTILGTGKQDFLTLILYSLLGILLGVGVNQLNKMLDSKLPKVYYNKWAAVPLKLLPPALILVAAQLFFSGFASNWQTTTPGVFFVALFFGVQTSLMEDVLRLV